MTNTIPSNPHTLFMQNAMIENMNGQGLIALMFRMYSRIYISPGDFAVFFTFSKGDWNIKIRPKTTAGKYAIKALCESCIKAELEGAQ